MTKPYNRRTAGSYFKSEPQGERPEEVGDIVKIQPDYMFEETYVIARVVELLGHNMRCETLKHVDNDKERKDLVGHSFSVARQGYLADTRSWSGAGPMPPLPPRITFLSTNPLPPI
jgi:hypothetical protein